MSVGTRILIFEDDVPSAVKLEANTAHDLPAHRLGTAPGLPSSTWRELRDLFSHVAELLGLASQHSHSEPDEVVRCGELALDLRTKQVARGGEPINITRLEFALLYALVRRQGVVATRQDLLREVWGPTAQIQPRAIDTHIARLRRKIEETPNHPRYILTAATLGYRLAPVPVGGAP